MMKKVVSDLRNFIIFFAIQIMLFSIILGILNVGNFDNPQDSFIKDYIHEMNSHYTDENFSYDDVTYPGFEYKHLSLFFANFLRTLRFSFGDFDFGSIVHLNHFESTVFWITWVITVLMNCIVFLNFIIAEVSQSYAGVE